MAKSCRLNDGFHCGAFIAFFFEKAGEFFKFALHFQTGVREASARSVNQAAPVSFVMGVLCRLVLRWPVNVLTGFFCTLLQGVKERRKKMKTMRFSRTQKRILAYAGVLSAILGIPAGVSAMHIMEGYLPASHCIAWGILCIPFLLAGFMSISRTLREHRNLITLLPCPVRTFL